AHERILLHRENLLHLVLLQLIAAEDDEAARLVMLDNRLDEVLAEGARAAGDEHALVVQIQPRLRKIAKTARSRRFDFSVIGNRQKDLGRALRHGYAPLKQGDGFKLCLTAAKDQAARIPKRNRRGPLASACGLRVPPN